MSKAIGPSPSSSSSSSPKKTAATAEKRKQIYDEIEPIIKKYKDDIVQRTVSNAVDISTPSIFQRRSYNLTFILHLDANCGEQRCFRRVFRPWHYGSVQGRDRQSLRL